MKILKSQLKKNIFPLIVGLLILVHIFILFQMVFFPYPELFVYSFLTTKGMLPYKQIIDQHFPGVMFLPLNLFSLGIDTLGKMRIVHLLLVATTDLIFVGVIRRLFGKGRYVYFGLLIFLLWQIYFEGHVLWIESFILPLLLTAFYFFLGFIEKRQYPKLYLSVFILGLSLVFKQTVLPVAAIVFLYMLYLKLPLKKIFSCLFLFVLPMSLVLLYLCRIGVFSDFFYWTVTFNLTTFAQMGKTHPTLTNLLKVMPVFGVSFFSILWLTIKGRIKDILLVGGFLLGTLFFAYARFDYIHLQPALPFAVISILFLVRSMPKRLLVPLVFLYLFAFVYLFIPTFRFYNKSESPMFNDRETQSLVDTVNKYRKPYEEVFAIATYPHIYYLLRTLPPGDIFSFQFPWFMKIAQDRVLEGVIYNPPGIIIRDRSAQVDNLTLVDYMGKLESYVDNHYRVIDKVGSNEILVKL